MADLTGITSKELAAIIEGWPNAPGPRRLANANNTRQHLLNLLEDYRRTHPQLCPPKPEPFTFTDAQGREHTFDTAHEATIDIIPKDKQQADAIALHDCYQAVKFTEAANNLFNEMDFKAYRGGPGDADKVPEFTPGQWYSAALAQFLTAMGSYGESGNCIGLTWQRWSDTLPNKAEFVMTKLSRHRDWMGLNLALADTIRLRFLIYPYHHNPRIPGFAVGYPGEESLGTEGRKTFPKGQATILKDLLLWHGADECRWVPERPGG